MAQKCNMQSGSTQTPEMCKAMDKDGDGKVTKQDIQMSGGKSPAGADLDVDGDGDIDQDDFSEMAQKCNMQSGSTQTPEMCKAMDLDGDGDVDEDDYNKMMQSGADK